MVTDPPAPLVFNAARSAPDAAEPAPYDGQSTRLTPVGAALGANLVRLAPGQVGCVFHGHTREHEWFYVLSGHGTLRYGAQVVAVGPGDAISCPAGTGVAHQIANRGTDDLVYLCVGPDDAHDVCFYPDTGKVSIRVLRQRGRLAPAEYYEGEPSPPLILGGALDSGDSDRPG